MSDDREFHSGGLDRCNNPYDLDRHPNAYRAYREGWKARCEDESHTQNPYETDGWTVQRAWMNGWQAAHLHFAQKPSSS